MDDLQETLKQLRDIHDPGPISVWLISPGWWILALLVILTISLFFIWFKKRKNPGIKILALEELNNITTNYEVQHNPHKTIIEVALLIRRTVVAKDIGEDKQRVCGLIDEAWLSYLDRKSRTLLFTQGPGKVLTTIAFQKKSDINVDVEGLLGATKVLLKNV